MMLSKEIIKIENVSKVFKTPHLRYYTLREQIFNFWRKKSYKELKALHDISFSVKEGEFLGIIGKNGSGKSTLLKVLTGIYPPTHGKIETNGKISPFLELGIGFNPELTARDNVYLNGIVLGLTKKEVDERFDSIFEYAELTDFIDTKLKHFSSGMNTRLAFSVSINVKSDILILDEVLAVGDLQFQEKCFKVFEKYKEKNKTIIFVTHDLDSVEKFCDRCILLEQGSIKYNGNSFEAVKKYRESV